MKKLGDATVITDCEHKTAPACESDARFGWSIGTKAIRNGSILYGQARPVDESTYRTFAARRTPVWGDLILAREAPVGDSVLVPKDTPVCLGQRTVLVSPNPDVLDSRFLYYVLRGPECQAWMALHSEGSTVKHLNVRDIYKIPLGALPSVDEQKRIAGVLGAFDDLIETNRQTISALEQLVHALFERAGFDQPARDADSATTVGELVKVNPTIAKPRGDAPYVDMAMLPIDGALLPRPAVRPARGGAKFMNGDTLLARITPCLENGKTAFVTNLGDGEVGVGSTEFIVLRGCGGTAGVWPYCLSRSPRFRAFTIQQLGDGTSGRQRLSADAVSNYRLPVPSADELGAFQRQSAPLVDSMVELHEEALSLARERDELLPLLMSGRVRVSELEGVM